MKRGRKRIPKMHKVQPLTGYLKAEDKRKLLNTYGTASNALKQLLNQINNNAKNQPSQAC